MRCTILVALVAVAVPGFAVPVTVNTSTLAPTAAIPAIPASDFGSGALTLAQIDSGINTANRIVNVADIVTSGVQALKDKFWPKRQLDTSGALALSDVDAGIHTAGNGVDLLDHLTDVAAKLKHLITGKRAEEGSGALALSDVDAGINTAGHGVDLVDHLTDLAGKLKHLFTGKRDLADVDAISQTVAQLLQRLHKQQQRRQTFVVPLGKTPPKSIPRPIIIDGQEFRFNGLRSLADLD